MAVEMECETKKSGDVAVGEPLATPNGSFASCQWPFEWD